MNEIIFGIYNQTYGKYYLVNVFSNLNNIDYDTLTTTFKGLFKNREITTKGIHEIGPFENHDELNKFGFNICQSLNANQINMMSADQYNQAIHDITNKDSFLSSLESAGEIIQNIDKKKPKKWDRFFL